MRTILMHGRQMAKRGGNGYKGGACDIQQVPVPEDGHLPSNDVLLPRPCPFPLSAQPCPMPPVPAAPLPIKSPPNQQLPATRIHQACHQHISPPPRPAPPHHILPHPTKIEHPPTHPPTHQASASPYPLPHPRPYPTLPHPTPPGNAHP